MLLKATKNRKPQKDSGTIKRVDVAMFEKVRSQMRRLSTDFEALSKKAPDAPMSKFKLTVVNEKLGDANRFLVPPFKPIEGFELFDDPILPSNSDAVMVLNQYLTCLERWRSAHIYFDESNYPKQWVWSVHGDSIPTERPTSVQ